MVLWFASHTPFIVGCDWPFCAFLCLFVPLVGHENHVLHFQESLVFVILELRAMGFQDEDKGEVLSWGQSFRLVCRVKRFHWI